MSKKHYVSDFIVKHLAKLGNTKPKATEWEKYYSIVQEICTGGKGLGEKPWGYLRVLPSTSVSFSFVITVQDEDGKYSQEYKIYNPNFQLLDWVESTLTSCEWSDHMVHQQIRDYAEQLEREEINV